MAEDHPIKETTASTNLSLDLAALIRANPSVFAGTAATAAADLIVQFLTTHQKLLITDSEIHVVQEADHRGDNGSGSVEWAVYTEPED